MTVQCPRCSTEYRVADARITDARPVFRCAHCGNKFSIGAANAPRGRSRAADRNLELDFGGEDAEPTASRPSRSAARNRPPAGTEGESEQGEEADSEFASDAEEDAPPPSAGAGRAEFDDRDAPRRPRSRRGDDADGDFHLGDSESAAGTSPPRRAKVSFADEFVDDPAGGDDSESVLLQPRTPKRKRSIEPRARRRPAASDRGKRSPLRAVTIGVGTVVLGWGLISLLAIAEPAAAMRWLRDTPLLGRLLGDDHLLAWRIQLDGIEGSYDQIKGNRRVLVVTGRAINGSTQNVRLIEVEGRLLIGDRESRRLVVYAANQFRKTIKGLAPGEVEMLLHLEPNKRFAVKPGESAGFLLVFADPPAGVTDVACKVVAASGA